MKQHELRMSLVKLSTPQLIAKIAKGGMNRTAATIAATLLEKRIG